MGALLSGLYREQRYINLENKIRWMLQGNFSFILELKIAGVVCNAWISSGGFHPTPGRLERIVGALSPLRRATKGHLVSCRKDGRAFQ